MVTSALRIGIAGCGLAARIHLDRLLAEDNVAIAGLADPEPAAARALADRVLTNARSRSSAATLPIYTDHRALSASNLRMHWRSSHRI